jgi:hypothetical protein
VAREQLIRDVLSLANGSLDTIGEPGYLVIGAGEQLNEWGSRELFDVRGQTLDADEIAEQVRPACDPSLAGVRSDLRKVRGAWIQVITIPPCDALYRTTQGLRIDSGYAAGKVLIRPDGPVLAASRDEVAALDAALEKRRRRPRRPVVFAMLAGGALGLMLGLARVGGIAPVGVQTLVLLLGLALGVLAGYVLGTGYVRLFESRLSWDRIRRLRLAFGPLIVVILALYVLSLFW